MKLIYIYYNLYEISTSTEAKVVFKGINKL